MLLGDKIVLQTRDGEHPILFLLDAGFIEDRIDFDKVRHTSYLGLNRKSGPNYTEYSWERHPSELIYEKDEAHVSGKWDTIKKVSVLIDETGLPWMRSPDYFNCVSGVVGCLWKAGFVYKGPLNDRYETASNPDFKRYGLDIVAPVLK